MAQSTKLVEERKKHADKWNFGDSVFGGRFIPETLMVAHKELEAAWNKWKVDPAFKAELATLRREFIGGPTPLYHAKRLSEMAGGEWLQSILSTVSAWHGMQYTQLSLAETPRSHLYLPSKGPPMRLTRSVLGSIMRMCL